MIEKQTIEFTRAEATQLWGIISAFLTDEIPHGCKIRIIDLLARKFLNQVADKLWSKVKPGQAKRSKVKISLSPEQILSIYACIELRAPGTPAAVAQGKIQQKVLNYDQVIELN